LLDAREVLGAARGWGLRRSAARRGKGATGGQLFDPVFQRELCQQQILFVRPQNRDLRLGLRQLNTLVNPFAR